MYGDKSGIGEEAKLGVLWNEKCCQCYQGNTIFIS